MAAEAAPATAVEDGGPDTAPAPSRFDSAAERAREWALPVGVFLLTRLVQLFVLAWMTKPDDTRPVGESMWWRLLSWDGGWFLRVATEGYPDGYTYDENGTLVGNGLAFLPGYPWLIKVFTWAGLRADAAALVSTLLVSVVAAIGVYALGKALHDRRTGIALVFCLGALPMAIVLSMGYSEALFLAFAVGGLLAIRRQAWILAGLCAAGACLTRVVGVAVVAALLIALVQFGVREWREGSFTLRTWWRAALGLVIGAVALPLYWWWVDLRVGEAGAWFAIQDAGWHSRWDFGAGTLAFLGDTFRSGEGWVPVSTAVLILLSVALLVSSAFARPWPPLLVYGAVIVAMALGTDGFYHSKLRLLVPALVLLVPAARALAKARAAVAWPVAGVALLFGTWYGAYMVTVWHYAI